MYRARVVEAVLQVKVPFLVFKINYVTDSGQIIPIVLEMRRLLQQLKCQKSAFVKMSVHLQSCI